MSYTLIPESSLKIRLVTLFLSRSDWNSSTMAVSVDSWYRTVLRAGGNASPYRQRMPQTMTIQLSHHLSPDHLSSPSSSVHPSEVLRMMTGPMMFGSLIALRSNHSPDLSQTEETG